jgi:hypothetical protein
LVTIGKQQEWTLTYGGRVQVRNDFNELYRPLPYNMYRYGGKSTAQPKLEPNQPSSKDVIQYQFAVDRRSCSTH